VRRTIDSDGSARSGVSAAIQFRFEATRTRLPGSRSPTGPLSRLGFADGAGPGRRSSGVGGRHRRRKPAGIFSRGWAETPPGPPVHARLASVRAGWASKAPPGARRRRRSPTSRGGTRPPPHRSGGGRVIPLQVLSCWQARSRGVMNARRASRPRTTLGRCKRSRRRCGSCQCWRSVRELPVLPGRHGVRRGRVGPGTGADHGAA
jgi:hypothetical protein